jgi:hypothetical protein
MCKAKEENLSFILSFRSHKEIKKKKVFYLN